MKQTENADNPASIMSNVVALLGRLLSGRCVNVARMSAVKLDRVGADKNAVALSVLLFFINAGIAIQSAATLRARNLITQKLTRLQRVYKQFFDVSQTIFVDRLAGPAHGPMPNFCGNLNLELLLALPSLHSR